MVHLIEEQQLLTCSVLSGNRNFEARIHPLVHSNFLCSPPLVVAYAIAGTMNIDLMNDSLGSDRDGNQVFLKDIWPSASEVQSVIRDTISPELFNSSYSKIFSGGPSWNSLNASESKLFAWDEASSYIKEPPFFNGMPDTPETLSNINNAAILAIFGDTITTDHISPAGAIPTESPAGQYLQKLGISPEDFNSYGSRRGNHEVMMRGTFANIRLRNHMVDKDGGFTRILQSHKTISIYDAAMLYKKNATPLVVFAGSDYGTGSSRDWAAKGTMLLGVKAVFAKSYERIHRSNLVGMGVLPLQFEDGIDASTLGINGSETITIEGISDDLIPGGKLTVLCKRRDGKMTRSFSALIRLDSAMEVEYYRHGGILHKVLRQALG